MSVCLDACALLAWLQNEPGADLVEEFLQRAATEVNFRCFISLINLGEVYYRLYRKRGRSDADAFWREVFQNWPLTPVEVTRKRVLEAARIKARYPLAFADAFAVQLSQEMGTPLLTGDPEIHALAKEENLSLIWIGSPESG